MAITYRNTKTGNTVDMPEAPEVLKAADKAAHDAAGKHTGKRAQNVLEAGLEAGVRQADAATKTIARMDESTKWERVTDDESAPAPQGSDDDTDSDDDPEPVKKATRKRS